MKPFVLRSFDPPITEVDGKTVTGIGRIGKRLTIGVEGDVYIVIHLMIAGRLRWAEGGPKLRGESASLRSIFRLGR